MKLKRLLGQTLTYWAPSGVRDVHGNEGFAAPVGISGRWEDRTETVVIRTGEEHQSRARVFLDQEVALEGWLFLGESVATDPKAVDGAREVVRVDGVPALRGGVTLYTAYL